MVALDRDLIIDLACITDMTVADVAERIGISIRTVERFYNRNRAELATARNETAVSDRIHAEVLALWGGQYSRDDIARRTGLSVAVVRRLILAAEYDEQPADQGASLELLALQMAHPGRMYIDEVRAVHETRAWLSAPDAGLRSAP